MIWFFSVSYDDVLSKPSQPLSFLKRFCGEKNSKKYLFFLFLDDFCECSDDSGGGRSAFDVAAEASS